MTDDLATLVDDLATLVGQAADEIERLREERDYLRHELNNETDRYMAMKETNSVHIAEIERLRSIIKEANQ